jgi:hypothetical protein
MELLIPGLILVALMVWASTKIKKRAAEAFDAEEIETDEYSIRKPDGFLHVIGDVGHVLSAYSKDFGTGGNASERRALIQLDFFSGESIENVRDRITEKATESTVRSDAKNICELQTEEPVNESGVRGFYKLVAVDHGVYRLRFAVLPEYVEDYVPRIEETLTSFSVKGN